MSAFEEILKELGPYFGLTLHPDSNQSCRVQFNKDLFFQLDLDLSGERLLIGTELGKLPPGGYRERVLKQALRVNGLSQSPRGTLAFSPKHSTLVLFQFMPLNNLRGEKVYKFLTLFLEHGRIWIDSIHRGEIPLLEEEVQEKKGPSR